MSSEASYDSSFRAKMQEALERVKLILESNKTFCCIDEVPHTYDDKYLLTETFTRVVLAAYLSIFEEIGLNSSYLDTLIAWAKTSEVSLRFEAIGMCRFINETIRTEEASQSIETTHSSGTTSSTKILTRITEYNFRLDVTYKLIAFKGVGGTEDTQLSLFTRSAYQAITLRSNISPFSEISSCIHDVNISWIIRKITKDNISNAIDCIFSINRAHNQCHTPRRNNDIKNLLEGVSKLFEWSGNIVKYIESICSIQSKYSSNRVLPNMKITNGKVFIPILPFLEHKGDEADEDCHVYGADTSSRLLIEMRRSYNELKQLLLTSFTPASDDVLICYPEAIINSAMHSILNICSNYTDSLNYIETILRKQLISAVGRIVTPADFDSYMQFHYRRLLRDEFQPKPFSYLVRRSLKHSPEGIVRIDRSSDGKTPQPLLTFSRSYLEPSSMHLSISVSSEVHFAGSRHIHLHLGHSFSGANHGAYSLVAQTRQFSSFILLVGTIASATEFEPKYGIILQNKDEVIIPLLLEQIPTAKEFKRAVQSLSPEQQQFASAIRSMQLSGTVFGVLVIQIKPHMERLLRLKQDSLTKEIALNQDLMDMFIKYQIPSDLLSFDGDDEAPANERLMQVKRHVEAIKSMILKAKEAEVEEKKLSDAAFYGARDFEASSGFGVGFGMSCAAFSSPSPGFSCPPPVDDAFSRMPLRGLNFASFPVSESSNAPAMPLVTSPPQSIPGFSQLEGGESAQRSANYTADTNDEIHEDSKDDYGDGKKNDGSTSVQANLSGDFTSLPTRLDDAHDKLDPDSALRSTIIKASEEWKMNHQQGLMRPLSSSTLSTDDLTTKRSSAFDLLEALSRSGSSTLTDTALHIVVASTHNFDKSLMDTVVQDNINPIDRVERSSLILASTIHDTPSVDILKLDQVTRVQLTSPRLFLN